MSDDLGIVVIGRNEGERLVRSLASVQDCGRIIYVDSGSTDGSVAAAEAAGARVVSLDLSIPFTAARARNAGCVALGPDVRLIQFIDGDCAVQPDWLDMARAAIADFVHRRADVAVTCCRMGRCCSSIPFSAKRLMLFVLSRSAAHRKNGISCAHPRGGCAKRSILMLLVKIGINL